MNLAKQLSQLIEASRGVYLIDTAKSEMLAEKLKSVMEAINENAARLKADLVTESEHPYYLTGSSLSEIAQAMMNGSYILLDFQGKSSLTKTEHVQFQEQFSKITDLCKVYASRIGLKLPQIYGIPETSGTEDNGK